MNLEKHLPLIGGLVIGLAALYLVNRIRAAASDPAGTAQGITTGIIDGIGGAGAGVVVGIGETVGIPKTNLTQCQQDMASGRTWDASFSCPAGDFIKYVTGR